MKSHTVEDFRRAAPKTTGHALEAVRTALYFLDKDKTRSIHAKVAGDYDYEELVAALVRAEYELSAQ